MNRRCHGIGPQQEDLLLQWQHVLEIRRCVNYVELDYPRDISMFAGVGRSIDAVFQWKNGTKYFFKGKHFWQFDDLRMRVAHRKPKSSAHFWMGCPRGLDTNDVDLEPLTRHRFTSVSESSGSSIAPISQIIFLTIVLLVGAKSLLLRTDSVGWLERQLLKN
ncbi:hypothetical protein QAD02_021873 [Eretmocerus hayati]|uniref:Uncharacterized protein n=1 Tax=Eretmocerus hayati TaxID=131215 RepID=A0ACC2PR51_9HYME|nr:hypothetical protein QAD02_021873 [Eretmocerus hayati]